MVAIIIFPSKAMLFSNFINVNDIALSKPDVGSSKIKQTGLDSNSIPIETLFFWPPEMLLENELPTLDYRH